MSLFLIDSLDMHEYPGFQFSVSVFSFQCLACVQTFPPLPQEKSCYQCHAIQNTEKRVVLVPKQAKLWLRDYLCQEIEKDHNYLIS